MKKIKTLSIAAFCIITALIISSCGITKNNDFAKQKYTNFKKGESTVKINHVEKARKDADLNSSVSDKIEIAQAAAVIGDYTSKKIETTKPEIKKESCKTTNQSNVVSKKIKKVMNSPTVSALMSKIAKKGNTASYNEDGYSIFWVVILILLILWAIGLLSGGFGLGGLINVLLVIALILLILWLLHLI